MVLYFYLSLDILKLCINYDYKEFHIVLNILDIIEFYILKCQTKHMKHNPNKLLVFISYASEDRQTVRYIASELEQAGFQPWFDDKQLLPGHDWKLEIEKAVP